MKPVLLALFWLGADPAPEAEADVVLRALTDEMARSLARLRLEKEVPPYYVEYTVKQTDRFHSVAAFGAITQKERKRARALSVDVRVGDYSLDSSSFGEGFDIGGFLGHMGGGGQVTLEDDYDALRHTLWLRTDEAYKQAIESLEAKKAYLQENNVQDRPDDFSKEPAVVAIKPTAALDIDEDRWAARLRKLSAVFRDFPQVQKSLVMGMAEAENRWFVNNEGFRNRGGSSDRGIIVLASAQAEDGMRMADFELFGGRAEKDLPSDEDMEKATRALAERLTRLAAAPRAEEYRGPILFEGQAAAEFFAQVLGPNLGRAHEALGSQGPLAGALAGNPLREKIGTRILPSFISVIDDPLAKEHAGRPLFGGYEIDDDGVRAQRMALVEKGVLKTLCMSRIPSRQIKQSNGHSRRGMGSPSILFIESQERQDAAGLRKKLLELGKDEDLPYVLVARRISNPLAAMLNPQSLMSSFMGRMGGGGAGIQAPILLYKVSVADGKEELVRGAQFGRMTLRALRDIVAAGDDAKAHLVIQGMEEGASLVTPSILLKEIEVVKPGKETEKPPALKNPYFGE